jgi:hypothetical protein
MNAAIYIAVPFATSPSFAKDFGEFLEVEKESNARPTKM